MKKESDVLGYTMVGFITYELILKHPYKLDDWVIYASLVPLLIDHFIHLMNC
jgi:hypothetical protein